MKENSEGIQFMLKFEVFQLVPDVLDKTGTQ
jgi:hypothetical protein